MPLQIDLSIRPEPADTGGAFQRPPRCLAGLLRHVHTFRVLGYCETSALLRGPQPAADPPAATLGCLTGRAAVEGFHVYDQPFDEEDAQLAAAASPRVPQFFRLQAGPRQSGYSRLTNG